MKIPNQIPLEMEEIINRELVTAQDKEQCLRRAYDILTTKYHGSRLKTVTKFLTLFNLDAFKLWRKSGFISCMQMNHLLKIMLVKSGFFKEEDVRLIWTILISWRTLIHPHQYVIVRINESKDINVDIWSKFCGIEFGDHAHGHYRITRRNINN